MNWLLERGYQILIKVKCWCRAEKLAACVTELKWFAPAPNQASVSALSIRDHLSRLVSSSLSVFPILLNRLSAILEEWG